MEASDRRVIGGLVRGVTRKATSSPQRRSIPFAERSRTEQGVEEERRHHRRVVGCPAVAVGADGRMRARANRARKRA
jgi:hypothetical protein